MKKIYTIIVYIWLWLMFLGVIAILIEPTVDKTMFTIALNIGAITHFTMGKDLLKDDNQVIFPYTKRIRRGS